MFVTGMTSDDGAVVAAVYTTGRLVIPVVVPVLAVGMLLTGILLGCGTKWGLTQWTWVVTKLGIWKPWGRTRWAKARRPERALVGAQPE